MSYGDRRPEELFHVMADALGIVFNEPHGKKPWLEYREDEPMSDEAVWEELLSDALDFVFDALMYGWADNFVGEAVNRKAMLIERAKRKVAG